MNSWWSLQLPVALSDNEKQIIEGLTGKVPILLNTLRLIDLASGGDDDEGEAHGDTFTVLLNRPWTSNEVKALIARITTMLHSHRDKYQASVKALE